MTPHEKHSRADELRELIANQEEALGRLRRTDQVEISRGGYGTSTIQVVPYHREGDTKGEMLYTPLENRLSKNPVHNVAVRFVDELIRASEKELEASKREYADLFSAE